jgi:hypothetical protein
MKASRRSFAPSALALGLALAGCSWSRFDELTTDTPVVVIERPGEIRSGFGTSLSSVTGKDDRALLLVHGASGYAQAALFDLGSNDTPLTSALSDGICSNDGGTCYLAASSAPLRQAIGPSGREFDNCFAVGVGKKPDDDAPGVLIECESREVFTLDVPEEFALVLQNSLNRGQPEVVALASGDGEPQSLVVGSEARQTAFYYPALDAVPQLLSGGALTTAGFGATVAIADVPGKRLIAVGSPAESVLHLFAAEANAEAVHLGCLHGEAGFGRALAVGAISADGLPELAVSDADGVQVFEASELLELELDALSDCAELDDLRASIVYASVSCSETGAVTGCAASDFGAALAVGDIDGDGDGELVVGAPGMKARDLAGAGAVAFFDLDDRNQGRAADLKFIASARDGDRLGTALTAARVASRHVIAAGIPGSGRTAVFYCPSLLPDSLGGARCD